MKPKRAGVWGRGEGKSCSAVQEAWAELQDVFSPDPVCIFWQLLKSQALQQELCVFSSGEEEEHRITALSAKKRRSWGQSCVGDSLGGGGKIFKKPVRCILLLQFNWAEANGGNFLIEQQLGKGNGNLSKALREKSTTKQSDDTCALNCFGSNAHTAETYHCSPVNSRHAAHLQPSPSLREWKERRSGLQNPSYFLVSAGNEVWEPVPAAGWRAAGIEEGCRAGADQVLPRSGMRQICI